MRIANQIRRSLFSLGLLAGLGAIGATQGVPMVQISESHAQVGAASCDWVVATEDAGAERSQRNTEAQPIDWRAMLPSVSLSTSFSR